MALAIQLLMLTLTRRNEVAGARKSEFDLQAGLWVIPAERAKADHRHVIPLSQPALSVLAESPHVAGPELTTVLLDVIAFLGVFGILAYLLKQEIWKDVR